MDLSGDYDAQSLQAQKRFLKELGPYRTLAVADSKDAFLRRVRILWFIRWPLKPARFLDIRGMHHREEQIWKDVCNDLMWSGVTSEVTEVHRNRGWRVHLRICEARSGIYRDPNYVDIFDDKAVREAAIRRQRDSEAASEEVAQNTGKKRRAEGEPIFHADDPSTRPRPRPRPIPSKKARTQTKEAETGER